MFLANYQERDVREGADFLMVKPGMAYLDIVRQTKDKVHNGLFTFSNFHSQDLAFLIENVHIIPCSLA